jgi:WD40 repeat protein
METYCSSCRPSINRRSNGFFQWWSVSIISITWSIMVIIWNRWNKLVEFDPDVNSYFDKLDFQARLYKRISSNNPYHKRIIWSCSFSHDDKYFATGARDQMVHIWRVNEKSNDDNEQPCEKNSLKLNHAVTAVTFASRLIDKEKFVKYTFFFSISRWIFFLI